MASNFGQFFGNNSTQANKNKNKRYRSLRIEELEGRDLLSVSPLGTDHDPLDTFGNNLYETEQIYQNGQNNVAAPVAAASAPIAVSAPAAIGQNNHAINITLGDGSNVILGGLSAADKATLEAGIYADATAFYAAIASFEFYDAEKMPGDYWGCGLGTAANMLAQSGWGDVNSFTSEDDIFDYFRDAFTYETGNEGGFSTADVLEWFMNGTSISNHTPVGGYTGGFHSSETFSSLYSKADLGYLSDFYSPADYYSAITDAAQRLLNGSAVGLSLYNGEVVYPAGTGPGGVLGGTDGEVVHAVSFYGVVTNSSGEVTAIFITDPDDARNATPTLASNGVVMYNFTFDSDGDLYLDGYTLDGWPATASNPYPGWYMWGFDFLQANDDVTPNAPTITTQPVTATYKLGDTVAPLSVVVTAPAGATLTYQWYKGTTAITGETSNTYTPDITAIGSATYYCVVTNTVGGTPYTTKSDTVTILVNDNDNPMDNATVVTLTNNSYTVTKEITQSGEFHMYKLTITQADIDAGKRFSFETSQLGFDAYIRLFDANGTQLAFDDDGTGSTAGDLLEYKFTTVGTYYLGISPLGSFDYDPWVADSGSGSSTGSYTLTITTKAVVPPAITNITFTSNGTYNVEKAIYSRNEFQLYKLTVTQADVDANRIFAFMAEGKGEFELGITLFDANWAELDYADAWDILSFKPTQEGTYYLGVSGDGCYYDPTDAESGQGGDWWNTGGYTLNVLSVTPTTEALTAQAVGTTNSISLAVDVAHLLARGITDIWGLDFLYREKGTQTWKYVDSINLVFPTMSGTVTGLKAGTTYEFQIKNGTKELLTAPIEVQTCTVKKDYPAVKGVKVDKKATTAESLTLTWTMDAKHNAKTDSFEIELFSPTNNVKPLGVVVMSVSASGNWTVGSVSGYDVSVKVNEVSTKNGVRTFSITVSGLMADTKYTAFVQAFNSKDGTASKEIKITAATKKWSAVKFEKSQSGKGSVTLTWKDTVPAPAGTIYYIGVFDSKGKPVTDAEWWGYLGFTAADGHESGTWKNDFEMQTKKGDWIDTYGVRTTAKSITITGLASQKYTFMVYAEDSNTWNMSAIAKTTASPASADAVKGLKAAKADSSKPGTTLLNWNAVSGATRYDITVYDAYGNVYYGSNRLNESGTASWDEKETKVLITGLLTQKYTFTVQAVTEKNTGTATNPNWVTESRSAEAKTTGTPASWGTKVSNLKATPKSGDAGMVAVDLKWDAVAEAEVYTIKVYKGKEEVKWNGGEVWGIAGAAPKTEYTVTDLEAGTKYTFIVQAEKQVKVGTMTTGGTTTDRKAYASTVAASATASTGKFDAVTGFTATPTSDAVELKWSAVSGANRYTIKVYKGKEEVQGKGGEVWGIAGAAPKTEYKVTGLEAGTKYTFEITARKPISDGGTSLGTVNSLVAKTNATTPKMTLATASTQDSITITLPVPNPSDWSATNPLPSDASYNYHYAYGADVYVVVGKNEPEGIWDPDYVKIADGKVTISNLKPGTKYSFIVNTTGVIIERQLRDADGKGNPGDWEYNSWVNSTQGLAINVAVSTSKLTL